MGAQRFLFTSNALSKRMLFLGLLKIILFQGKQSIRKSRTLLASFFGVDEKQVFLFGAGRMSVYHLLKSLNLQKEDEVIVAGYTCVVLTNAVKFAGCQVRYVDIAKDDVNPTLAQVIDQVNAKTKVLILPHNFGIPFEGIAAIKKQYPDLILIEDAAHTLASSTKSGQLCGTLGDAAFFSLEYSKPLTTGLGGVMIINNERLLDAFQRGYEPLKTWKGKDVFKMTATLVAYNLSYFRNSNFIQINAMRVLRLMRWQYGTSQKEIDGELPNNYPVKMSGTQACFLPIQLKRIESINTKKVAICTTYEAFFNAFKSIQTIEADNRLVLVRYPILFDDSVNDDVIEALKNDALKEGYNFGVWFNDVVHPTGSFRYCYQEGDCPNGEYLARRILNLPVNANYPPTEKDLNYLNSLFRKYEIH